VFFFNLVFYFINTLFLVNYQTFLNVNPFLKTLSILANQKHFVDLLRSSYERGAKIRFLNLWQK